MFVATGPSNGMFVNVSVQYGCKHELTVTLTAPTVTVTDLVGKPGKGRVRVGSGWGQWACKEEAKSVDLCCKSMAKRFLRTVSERAISWPGWLRWGRNQSQPWLQGGAAREASARLHTEAGSAGGSGDVSAMAASGQSTVRGGGGRM